MNQKEFQIKYSPTLNEIEKLESFDLNDYLLNRLKFQTSILLSLLFLALPLFFYSIFGFIFSVNEQYFFLGCCVLFAFHGFFMNKQLEKMNSTNMKSNKTLKSLINESLLSDLWKSFGERNEQRLFGSEFKNFLIEMNKDDTSEIHLVSKFLNLINLLKIEQGEQYALTQIKNFSTNN